jgi:hypothetical protein
MRANFNKYLVPKYLRLNHLAGTAGENSVFLVRTNRATSDYRRLAGWKSMNFVVLRFAHDDRRKWAANFWGAILGICRTQMTDQWRSGPLPPGEGEGATGGMPEG